MRRAGRWRPRLQQRIHSCVICVSRVIGIDAGELFGARRVGIRVHGDVALVTALGTWTRKDGSSGRTRYIDVWVRKDGAWKAVSAQLTAVN